MDRDSYNFWNGYACAMEVLSYKLSNGVPVEEVIEFADKEVVKADEKIERAEKDV